MFKDCLRRKQCKKKKAEKASSSDVNQSVSTHVIPTPSYAVGFQIPANSQVRSPLPKNQSNVSTKSVGATHVTEFGPNADFAGAAAIAFGAQSTATHNSYHIRLGDQELIETQVEFMEGLRSFPNKIGKLDSRQPSTNLPRAMAAHNDYAPQRELGPCFQDTRETVLEEIENWFGVIGRSQIYVLCGMAGIGKSTIAYTVAQRADRLGLLGASFFFSKQETERRRGEKFFTTIAFHLCVYDVEFARAIESVLSTNQGMSATTKDPETQLSVLIIEPLRVLVRSRTQPVIIIVDALDECEDRDAQVILKALGQLVRDIPSFKVLLTTRPQPHFNHLLSSHDVFYLHNIDNNIVNDDIRRYLQFSLSMDQVESILPALRTPWSATDEDIDALVQAAGKLFIVASTSILLILDKAVRNPDSQMKRLRRELAQNLTPFKALALDGFYSIILHAVIPSDSDHVLVERFQKVVGTIALLYDPLPVDALACLIDIQEDDIYAVLDNLQSVILLSADDIPYIYHKSFSDWITGAEYCKDKNYRIDPTDGHTLLTTHCLQIMNERLKRNILNIDGGGQFMTTNEALKQRRIKEEMQEKISPVLQYACIYWARHLEEANINDADLMDKLNIFADKHLLHWIEGVGWIASTSYFQLFVKGVHKVPEHATLAKLRELLSDALRFLSKFWPIVTTSALSTYHSALPFTPTKTLFYQRYNREMMDNICRVHGGPRRWDAVVKNVIRGPHIGCITYLERDIFASCSPACITFWDSLTGTCYGTFDCKKIALGNNFGMAAAWQNTISLLEFPHLSCFTTIDVSAPILTMALSFNGHRLAVAFSDDSVILWVVGVSTPIAKFDGLGSDDGSSRQFTFSPNGDMLAYRLVGGGVALRNAINGKHVADLKYNITMVHRLVFSPDGSQLASLFVEDDNKHILTLWDCTVGKFLVAVQDIGSEVAFSVDGSLIATGGLNNALKLWSGNNKDQDLHFIEAPDLSSLESIICLAFSQDGMLAIGSADTEIILYDVARRSIIATIPFPKPTAIALSTDCTHLAIGNEDGDFCLLDVPTIKASAQTSQANAATVSALVFSPDCSRLVSGSEDGIVRIWNTSCASEPIATREGHSSKITTIGFAPNGGQFASGDANGTIKLWSSDDCALCDTVQWPISGELTSVAVSKYVLAAATNHSIALWDLQRSCIIGRLGDRGSTLLSLSNQNENLLLASFDGGSNTVTLWNVESRTLSAAFSDIARPLIERVVFYPDDSHLFGHHVGDSAFFIFDVVNKVLVPGDLPISGAIDQGVIPSWKGTPVWMCCSDKLYFLRGRFSEGDGNYTYRTVCQLPEDLDVVKVAYGSSMFALQCKDGSLILLQSN